MSRIDPYSEADVETFRHMWLVEKATMTAIAMKLDRSVGSVSSKRRTLGLPPRPMSPKRQEPVENYRPREAVRAPVQPPTAPTIAEVAVEPIDAPVSVHASPLGRGCCYPLWPPEPRYTYCGRALKEGSRSWCNEHYRACISYTVKLR